MDKRVEKFSSGLSVLSVFQQAESQCLGHNCWYKSPMVLNFCEHLDHEDQHNFSSQHFG
jgi:hypothetical protein